MSGSNPELVRLLQACERAMRGGDIAASRRFAVEAASRHEVRPQILVLASAGALERGDGDAALGFAERAMAASRHDGDVLNAYGNVLGACGRFAEALKAFDAAIRQAPTRASFHYNRACVLDSMGNNNQARMGYERSVALQPDNPQALGRLAFLEMQRGETAAARDYAARALRLMANEPTATLALAMVDLHEKKFQDALRRAQALSQGRADVNRAIAQGIVGDALDGLGRQADAFRAYQATGDLLRALHRSYYEAPNRESASALVERLTRYFASAPAGKWRAAPAEPAASEIGLEPKTHVNETPERAGRDRAPADRRPRRGGGQSEPAASDINHIFLVGFPRSGTTLLEQALARHPDVETMDERSCLTDAEEEFLGDEGLDRLAAMSGDALEPWRERYWRRVGAYGVAPAKPVFLDKLPLNLVVLPLVAKLFPNAKILFALRDPADVVWSAFRRRFGMNAHMYELTTLAGTARHYDAVMRLTDIYRDVLGLDWHETVYERTVADFAGETRRICDFLGIAWNEAMTDFAAGSRKRAPNTPSAPQLAKGLYSHAIGQWTAYREQLEPILPIIRPWRQRFGYEET